MLFAHGAVARKASGAAAVDAAADVEGQSVGGRAHKTVGKGQGGSGRWKRGVAITNLALLHGPRSLTSRNERLGVAAPLQNVVYARCALITTIPTQYEFMTCP